MNNYASEKKFVTLFPETLKDTVTSKYEPTLTMSTALLAGSSIVNSTQYLKHHSDAIDNEFNNLKRHTYGDPDHLRRVELEKFRQQKDNLGITKTDEEKLADKFFLEMKYKDENQRRARDEIGEIQLNLGKLEKFLTNSKEIEMKKELKALLNERITLTDLEKELYEDISKFRELYDKTEYSRLSGKKLTIGENRERLQKMNDLKTKKEQIDHERFRLRANLETIKNADFRNLNHNTSELLQTAQKKKLDLSNVSINAFKFGIDNLKSSINAGNNKLRDMKAEYSTFVTKERHLDDELERTLNPTGIDTFQRSSAPNLQARTYTSNNQNSPNPNINNTTRVSDYFHNQTMNDIDTLKRNFAESSNQDPTYLKDLKKVEDLYKSLVQKTSPLKTYGGDDHQAYANLNTTGSPQKLNETTTGGVFNGDAYATRISAYDPLQQSHNGSMMPLITPQSTFGNRTNRDPLKEFRDGTDKISRLLDDGNTTLNDMRSRFANGQSVSYPHGNNPAFDRGISDEENQLQEYARQEKELLNTLHSLPVGTRLYQEALKKVQELSQLKTELEKIIREQKLSRNWQNQTSQPQNVDYDTRRREISTSLKKKTFGSKLKGYNPNIGFILNFEWINALSKSHNHCQILYGVHASWEILSPPALMSYHKCQPDAKTFNKCIFDEKYYIYDIVPVTPALLIFQIEVHHSPDLLTPERAETLGWTMIDLFNWEGELKRGKWRLPVYEKPANTEINVEQIRFLKRMKDVWLFIRLLLPNDDELIADGSRASEALAAEHAIPEIHIRFWDETKPLEGPERPIIITQVHHVPASDSSSSGSSSSEESEEESEESKEDTPKEEEDNDNHDDSEERRRRQREEDEEAERRRREEEEARRRAEQEQPGNYEINLLQMKGIKVTILGLKDYSTLNKFRVTGALMDGNQVILDENGKVCAFTTKAKVLPELNKTALDISRADHSLPTKGQSIGLNEEVLFLKNLPALIASKQNKLDIILVFQLIEAENKDATNNKTMLNTTRMNKTNQTFDESLGDTTMVQDLDESTQAGYQIASWYAMKINKPDGTIQYGKFEKPLFFEPVVKPPFDEAKMPKTETTIAFVIEEFEFDADLLAKHKKGKKGKKNKGDKSMLTKKKPKAKQEWVIDPRPFIVNTKRQYIDRPFEKGNGIDLYIDACRFLPDNVTVCKIILHVLTANKGKICQPQAALPELDCTTFSPIFKFKMELRSPHFDPTAIAFLSIETVDNNVQEVRTVGYCAMNLFISNKTKKPPTSEADGDVILMNGLYQLPIYCQEPYKRKPFNMDVMIKLDKMPCASLLFRVQQAPKTEDGQKVLSKEDVPEKDWEKKEVWIPAPPYGAGRYNTTYCNVRDSEKDLFYLRQQREDPPLRTTSTILVNSEGITKEFNDEEMLDWIDSKIKKTDSTEIIDLQYFAKYQPKSGFKFALDGFHNVPDSSIPYIGLYCLNPPAALYQHPLDANLVHLNSNFNWEESAAQSPQFLEGFVTFRDIKFDKNLTLIIDVQTIAFKKKTVPVFKTIGWTVLPIFSPNGYVQSGIYQLPVFEGAVPKDIIEQLPVNDPWPFLMELVAQKKSRVKFLEPMSAIVRLLDSQREGHFQKTFDYDRIEKKFLPPKKMSSYAYNIAVDSRLQKAKRLTTIVPSNGNPKEYNKKITSAFVQELGLHQYQLE